MTTTNTNEAGATATTATPGASPAAPTTTRATKTTLATTAMGTRAAALAALLLVAGAASTACPTDAGGGASRSAAANETTFPSTTTPMTTTPATTAPATTAPATTASSSTAKSDAPAIPNGPVRPDQVCGVVHAVLDQQLAGIDATCSNTADCVLRDAQYDPCDPPRAFRKGTEDFVDALNDLRRDARKECGFLAQPCAQPMHHAACEAGRCVAREGRAPTAAPVWEAVLRSNDGVLDGVTVRADLLQRVQCVAAPCDPVSVGSRTLTLAKSGLIRIDLTAASMGAPDAAVLALKGYAPLRVELRPTTTPIDVLLVRGE